MNFFVLKSPYRFLSCREDEFSPFGSNIWFKSSNSAQKTQIILEFRKNTKINMKYAKQSGVAQETVFQKIFAILHSEIEVFMNVSLILTLIAYLVVFVTIGVAVQHVLKNFSSLGVAPRVRRS